MTQNGKKKPSHLFGRGNDMGATPRRRQAVAEMLPGLVELSQDRTVPARWRRRLSAAIRALRTSPASELADRMRETAATLRQLADATDGGGE